MTTGLWRGLALRLGSLGGRLVFVVCATLAVTAGATLAVAASLWSHEMENIHRAKFAEAIADIHDQIDRNEAPFDDQLDRGILDRPGKRLGSVGRFPVTALSLTSLVVSGDLTGSMLDRVRVPFAGVVASGAYSLYLSHKIAFHLVGNWDPMILRVPAQLGAAATLAAILYFGVERPSLLLRERLAGSSRTALAAGR